MFKLARGCRSGDCSSGRTEGAAYLGTKGGDRSDRYHDNQSHHNSVFNRSGAIFILQERTEFVSNKIHLRLICKVFEQIKTESAKSTHRFIIIGK